jgi:ribA/ribD-fused uncharacterized protein
VRKRQPPLGVITHFTGDEHFLSNFYLSPVLLGNIWYPSGEHAFVSLKTIDPRIKRKVAQIETPLEAKRYGRKIELRPEWDDRRVEMMSRVIRSKFSPTRNRHLAQQLVRTRGYTLVEGNHWGDLYWGACYFTNNNRVPDMKVWHRDGNIPLIGFNFLGSLLMIRRDQLIAEGVT